MFKNMQTKINFFKIFIIIYSILCVSFLIGCSSKKKKVKPTNISYDNKKIENALIKAADSIESSLFSLSNTKESTDPALIDTLPLMTAEGGMGNKVSIDWVGPIAPLLFKIANMSGYKLKILGKEPAIPITITITKKKEFVADILKNASLQAKDRASVVVFPENKILELRYNEC